MDIQQTITAKLAEQLTPAHLEVEDESHQHNVPDGAQSHFKVTIVAAAFADLTPVARHRRVFQILQTELAGPVHALALHTYSPAEWQETGSSPESPPCLGGGKDS